MAILVLVPSRLASICCGCTVHVVGCLVDMPLFVRSAYLSNIVTGCSLELLFWDYRHAMSEFDVISLSKYKSSGILKK